jgi:hypothetical protein
MWLLYSSTAAGLNVSATPGEILDSLAKAYREAEYSAAASDWQATDTVSTHLAAGPAYHLLSDHFSQQTSSWAVLTARFPLALLQRVTCMSCELTMIVELVQPFHVSPPQIRSRSSGHRP